MPLSLCLYRHILLVLSPWRPGLIHTLRWAASEMVPSDPCLWAPMPSRECGWGLVMDPNTESLATVVSKLPLGLGDRKMPVVLTLSSSLSRGSEPSL